MDSRLTKGIVVFSTKPSYEEWCEENNLDPSDDDNYNSYSEWRANQ